MKSNHDQIKSQAIALASAFVANGDVRICRDFNADSDTMLMLGDLIDSLYVMLSVTHARLDERADD